MASRATPPALPALPLFTVVATTHFEFGAKLGALATPRVQRWLSDYRPLQHTLLPFVATAPGAAALDSLLNASCAQFPHYCDEIEGLSHGSGAPLQSLQVLSLRHELTTLAGAAPHPECTDVLSAGVIAHNEDVSPELKASAFLVNASISETDTAYLAFHYPGTTAGHAFGFNHRARVAVTMNAIFPLQVDVGGSGCYYLSRAALDATSAADAVRRLSVRSAYGGSLNFGEVASGAVHNLEFAPHRTAPNLSDAVPASGAFHMNNYRRMLDVPAKDDASSDHRLRRARAIAKDHPVSAADLNSFWRVLGDRADPSYPLWRNTTKDDGGATAATATFELGVPALTIHVGGPPSDPATPRVRYVL